MAVAGGPDDHHAGLPAAAPFEWCLLYPTDQVMMSRCPPQHGLVLPAGTACGTSFG
jgi:hypothetical protein